ncbi:MAG: hypothetical protein HY758_08650 [Nitrospirae bacterium]|nr:hypothetical protein [Nitrospirota bacterium]
MRKNLLPSFFQFQELTKKELMDFLWVFPVWLTFFAYQGLYSKRFSFWDEIKTLWKVVFFSTVSVFSVLYLGKKGEQISRTVIVIMSLIALPAFPMLRISAKKLLFSIGLMKSKVLVLGAGKTGELIFSALQKDKNLGLDVVGFLDDDPAKIGGKIGGIKIHGGVDRAQKYIGRCCINDVIIAMPGCDKDRLISIINKLQHKTRNILLIRDSRARNQPPAFFSGAGHRP